MDQNGFYQFRLMDEMIDKNSEGEVFIMDFATHGAEGPMLPF
jgi:hypothetical protein